MGIKNDYIDVDGAILTTFKRLIKHPYMVYSEIDFVSLLYVELIKKDIKFVKTKNSYMSVNRVHTEYPYTPVRTDCNKNSVKNKTHDVDVVVMKEKDIENINGKLGYPFIIDQKRSVACSHLIEIKVKEEGIADREILCDFQNLRGCYNEYKQYTPDCELYFICYQIWDNKKSVKEKRDAHADRYSRFFKLAEEEKERKINFYLLIGPIEGGHAYTWRMALEKFNNLKKEFDRKIFFF